MDIIRFLISLAGATMLLLYSVRLVRTGIERAHGASFQRLMERQTNLISASALGVTLAMVLQSSAAVALLASGFLASGFLSFVVGFAIVLGGDFGSALVVQILSFPIDWLIPLLLAIGGWMVVKSESRRIRQYGRVTMGIALILVSLSFLRDAIDPVRQSNFLPAVASYLERDLITAFIVGAALAFVMHSSVATILVLVTLMQFDALPFQAALALLLGANLGSGFIPVWLTRGMIREARRLVLANLFARGVMALAALLALIMFGDLLALPSSVGAQYLILCHVGFNFALILAALPFAHPIGAMMVKLLPDSQPISDPESLATHSALAPDAIGTPKLAITSLKQELLRMSGFVEAMFRPALDLYETGTPEKIQAVRDMDSNVNECLSGIRTFVANIPLDRYSKVEAGLARDMLEYAIRLETAGDIVARRFTKYAKEFRAKRLRFSPEGHAELQEMHEHIMANFKLAANVLISDDPESARLLSLEKTEIKRIERQSRKRHLKRLQSGNSESFETSDIHLETLRALREFNGHIAAVAYPILYHTGQLLETRLIQDLPDQRSASDPDLV